LLPASPLSFGPTGSTDGQNCGLPLRYQSLELILHLLIVILIDQC